MFSSQVSSLVLQDRRIMGLLYIGASGGIGLETVKLFLDACTNTIWKDTLFIGLHEESSLLRRILTCVCGQIFKTLPFRRFL